MQLLLERDAEGQAHSCQGALFNGELLLNARV